MSSVATGRPGRPAAATRQDALALARARFLAGERVDVQAIARELGLARATMHRWFGTREVLLGEMLAALGEERLRAIARAHARHRRARAARLLRQLQPRARRHQRAAARGSPGAGARAAHPHLERRHRPAAHGERDRRPDRHGGRVGGVRVRRSPPRRSPTRSCGSPSRSSTTTRSFGIRGDTDRLREIEAALLGLDGS